MVHEKVYDEVVQKLVAAYPTIAIGDPLDPSKHFSEKKRLKFSRNSLRSFTQKGIC